MVDNGKEMNKSWTKMHKSYILLLEVFRMLRILFGSYVVIFPRMYSYLEKWEKTNEETMCIFPPLVHHRLQNIDGVY